VFDRGILTAPDAVPTHVPIRRMTARTVRETHPDVLLKSLGLGQADSGTQYGIRVVHDDAWHRAHRALLLSLRKPIDGLISRHLNRYISTFITQYVVRTGVSPNLLTILFLGLGLLSAWFAYQAQPWWSLVLAGFLFQSQSVLDGCDGEIARLTYRFSHVGQWLDSVGDDITNYAFCFALALGQARVTGYDWLYGLGCLTLGIQLLGSAVLYRRLVMMKTGDLLAIPNLLNEDEDAENPSLFTRLSLLFKRDFFVFAIALITACQYPIVAFLLFSLGTFPTIYFVILNDIKLGRQQRESSSR